MTVKIFQRKLGSHGELPVSRTKLIDMQNKFPHPAGKYHGLLHPIYTYDSLPRDVIKKKCFAVASMKTAAPDRMERPIYRSVGTKGKKKLRYRESNPGLDGESVKC